MQEELNKLRQSTSQALGGENPRSNASAPSGNLANLGSTLNNLNQTLNRLNQTLGRLNQTGMQSRANAPLFSQNTSQTVVPAVAGALGQQGSRWQANPYRFGQFTDAVVRREVANAVRNAVAQDASTAWSQQTGDSGIYGIFGSLRFEKNLGAKAGLPGTSTQRQIFGDYFSGSSFGDLSRNKDILDY